MTPKSKKITFFSSILGYTAGGFARRAAGILPVSFSHVDLGAGWTFGCSGWRKKLAWLLSCLAAVWSWADWGCCYIFRLAEVAVSCHWMKSRSRSGLNLSDRAGLCVASSWITCIATSQHQALDHALEWSACASVHTGGLSWRRYFQDLLRPCLR